MTAARRTRFFFFLNPYADVAFTRCPKCEANQLERPKTTREVKPRATPRASRAMAPLLDEDEDAMVVKKEELDLGVAGVDEAVTKFIGAEEPEEEPAEEEEEEL